MPQSINYEHPVVTSKRCEVENVGEYKKAGRSEFLNEVESFKNNYKRKYWGKHPVAIPV